MFAQLFNCPTHGDVWQVETTEVVDTVNDEVYPVVMCAKCLRDVTPVLYDGKPVYHALTHEDMFWEMYAEEED